MQTYLVERMEGDDVIAGHIINAPSPFRAASMATDQHITLRTWEKDWVRVTDENRGQIFAYCFVSSGYAANGARSDNKRDKPEFAAECRQSSPLFPAQLHASKTAPRPFADKKKMT
ncbi:hypothetical protein [Mesorhizobium sp. STM 4661]|uniref:hypothetical protein n=1 Tax=Mesorhizobium sp. STM 4661 TaxID=1297570 RepID=UPI000563358D|nr:hypothetical protein [Mesorhizobium sp. STM 4661]